MKTCTLCKIEKPLEAFSLVAGRTTPRSHCKACRAEYKRAARAANPEATKAARKRWKATEKAKDPDFYKKKKAAYRRSSPGMWEVTRKAAKLRFKQAAVKWGTRRAMAAFYAQAAAIREGGGDATVDHIVPLNHDLVCGLHNEFNLQILTFMENVEKSNKFHV